MNRFVFSCSLLVCGARFASAQATNLSRSDAVRDALSRSPRSNVLAADTLEAFAGLLTARALPNPALSAAYSKAAPTYHLIADLPIDYLWLRGLRVQAADMNRLAASYRYEYGRASVALDADTTYTRALAARARMQLSARTTLATDSLLRMAMARRNAGDASDLDVQLAVVNAAQQANVAAGDSLSATSAVLDLQAILGLSMTDVSIVLTDSLGEPPVGDATTTQPATLPVAAAQAALEGATLSARLQRKSLWSGTGIMFGVEAGDPGGTGNALLPTFGLSIPLPFLDRNRGGIAQADADRLRAEWELSLARTETQSRIAHATRERANALGRLARDRVTVAAANQVATMSLTAYREGAMALPNVLEAQRTARDVLAQYIDDLTAAWIANASLDFFLLPPPAH